MVKSKAFDKQPLMRTTVYTFIETQHKQKQYHKNGKYNDYYYNKVCDNRLS